MRDGETDEHGDQGNPSGVLTGLAQSTRVPGPRSFQIHGNTSGWQFEHSEPWMTGSSQNEM